MEEIVLFDIYFMGVGIFIIGFDVIVELRFYLMLSRCISTVSKNALSYSFATQRIKVKNAVAELDGD